jgi:hypothetical protein
MGIGKPKTHYMLICMYHDSFHLLLQFYIPIHEVKWRDQLRHPGSSCSDSLRAELIQQYEHQEVIWVLKVKASISSLSEPHTGACPWTFLYFLCCAVQFLVFRNTSRSLPSFIHDTVEGVMNVISVDCYDDGWLSGCRSEVVVLDRYWATVCGWVRPVFLCCLGPLSRTRRNLNARYLSYTNQLSPSSQHYSLTILSMSLLPATYFWRRGYCDLTSKFCPWLNTGSDASPHLFFIFSWWNEFSIRLHC